MARVSPRRWIANIMMTNSKNTSNPWSDILRVMRHDQFGFNIFASILLILLISILICMLIEKKYRFLGSSIDQKRLGRAITFKRVFTGALIGYLFAVYAGTAQFILRYHFWTWFQEMGAIFAGILGAIIGGFLGLFKWRRKP